MSSVFFKFDTDGTHSALTSTRRVQSATSCTLDPHAPLQYSALILILASTPEATTYQCQHVMCAWLWATAASVSTRTVLGQLVANTAGTWVAATFSTTSVTQTVLKGWSSKMMSLSQEMMITMPTLVTSPISLHPSSICHICHLLIHIHLLLRLTLSICLITHN